MGDEIDWRLLRRMTNMAGGCTGGLVPDDVPALLADPRTTYLTPRMKALLTTPISRMSQADIDAERCRLAIAEAERVVRMANAVVEAANRGASPAEILAAATKDYTEPLRTMPDGSQIGRFANGQRYQINAPKHDYVSTCLDCTHGLTAADSEQDRCPYCGVS